MAGPPALKIDRMLPDIFAFLIFVCTPLLAVFLLPLRGARLPEFATFMIIGILAVPATIAIHELLHMLAAFACGARRLEIGLARKGSVPWAVYVRIKDASLSRRDYAVLALAPLSLNPLLVLLIRHGGLLGSAALWILVTNTLGACGDLALLAYVALAPRGTRLKDEGSSMLILISRPEVWRRRAARLRAFCRTYLAAFAIIAILLLAAPFATLASKGGLVLTIFGLRVLETDVNPGEGFSITYGAGAFLILIIAPVLPAAVHALCTRGQAFSGAPRPHDRG